jgi:hypothetical protein
MKVQCPSCVRFITAAEMDLAAGRAACASCGELFPLPSVALQTRAGSLALPADLNCQEIEHGETLSLVLKPSRFAGLVQAAFAAVWDGFLVFWYATAFRHPSPGGMALWFPLLHVGVGVFVTWNALRKLFNRTTIRLTRERLTIAEGPVPAYARLDVPIAAVERFEAGRREQSTKGGTRSLPIVLLLTRDGRSQPLRVECAGDDQSRWLSTRLNEHLAIVQAPPIPKTYRG